MPLEDTSKVDAISTDPKTGFVVLTIFDAWDWSDERIHLLTLQAKLNAYFDFIQSGQIREAYPAAEGRPLAIRVMTKFPLSFSGQEFLQRAATAASQLNVAILHLHLEETASDQQKVC